jgi:hypothetical protein
MERAHKVVLDAVARHAPNGGNIIDLGCGNGMLLKKVVSVNSQLVPFGVELSAEKVSRAAHLLPESRNNFVVADIFSAAADRHLRSRRYTVTLLMLGRLDEVSKDKALATLDTVAGSTDILLGYFYGRHANSARRIASKFGLSLNDEVVHPLVYLARVEVAKVATASVASETVGGER